MSRRERYWKRAIRAAGTRGQRGKQSGIERGEVTAAWVVLELGRRVEGPERPMRRSRGEMESERKGMTSMVCRQHKEALSRVRQPDAMMRWSDVGRCSRLQADAS